MINCYKFPKYKYNTNFSKLIDLLILYFKNSCEKCKNILTTKIISKRIEF